MDAPDPTPYAVLLQLASLQSSPVAKIKCLYAARNSRDTSPHMRAYASYCAAQIIINDYSTSETALKEAKTLLLSAERDLKSSKHISNSASYLATLSLLGECHILLGDDASAAAVFQAGVRAAASSGSSAAPTSPSPASAADQSVRWQAHFLLFLARAESDQQNGQKKVDEHLKAVEALNIDDPVYRTVLALSQAVSAMQRGDTSLADQYLTRTATELVGALRRSNSSSTASAGSSWASQSTPKHFIESLRAHYYLLYALNAHMGGRTAHLASEGTYPAYEEFFKAVERLDKLAEDGEPESLLLPLDDVDLKTCGEVMYDNVLRMSGDGGSSISSINTGTEGGSGSLLKANARGNSAARMDLDNNNNNKNSNNIISSRCVQYLEYEAMRALTVCDFHAAAKTLLEAVQEDSRAGDGGARSKSLPLLLGQYLHSTREYDAALALLDDLWSTSKKGGDPRAAPRAALVELERNDINGAAARMAALKNAVDVDALPAHERAIVQMVGGLILLRQDDCTGARLLLTKALKQAHGMVGSGQFVGQILNCLAPVQQMRQDHSGALQMLESAATLLKSAKDLMSLVTTLVAMEKLYIAMKQDDKAASCRQYLEKKNAELSKRLQSVHSSGAHKELVRRIAF